MGMGLDSFSILIQLPVCMDDRCQPFPSLNPLAESSSFTVLPMSHWRWSSVHFSTATKMWPVRSRPLNLFGCLRLRLLLGLGTRSLELLEDLRINRVGRPVKLPQILH